MAVLLSLWPVPVTVGEGRQVKPWASAVWDASGFRALNNSFQLLHKTAGEGHLMTQLHICTLGQPWPDQFHICIPGQQSNASVDPLPGGYKGSEWGETDSNSILVRYSDSRYLILLVLVMGYLQY